MERQGQERSWVTFACESDKHVKDVAENGAEGSSICRAVILYVSVTHKHASALIVSTSLDVLLRMSGRGQRGADKHNQRKAK